MEHLKPKQAHAVPQGAIPTRSSSTAAARWSTCSSGHPVGAMMVPWYDGAEWELNPHFVGQVKKLAGANFEKRPIVLICRSGNRTIEAGEALERAGFKHVVNVLHGFEGELDENHHRNSRNGWRVDGLPWEQYLSGERSPPPARSRGWSGGSAPRSTSSRSTSASPPRSSRRSSRASSGSPPRRSATSRRSTSTATSRCRSRRACSPTAGGRAACSPRARRSPPLGTLRLRARAERRVGERGAPR